MAIVRRNDPVRLFGRRVFLVGMFTLVIFGIAGVWSAHQKEKESGALRTEAEVQLSDLSERQAQLTADIGKLQTDRGKEEALRQQYALAAKGEGLIVIVDPSEQKPVQATSSVLEWLHKVLPWW